MQIEENVMFFSKSRLNFDPYQLSAELARQRPLDNSSDEKTRQRINHLKLQENAAYPIALERLIDRSDLMNINYLHKGVIASDAVGKITTRNNHGDYIPNGTGFLISPQLLMTNWHVLRNEEVCQNSQVEFNNQYSENGQLSESANFLFQPEEFFFTDKALDFAIVAIAQTSLTKEKLLENYGYLPLNPDLGKILPGEYVTIIQHPNGEPKQIALRENQLLKLEQDVLWYRTDTAPGSSGSPVLNDSWQVVALHRAGVPEEDEHGNRLTLDGQIWEPRMGETQVKYKANEGTRVSRIVETVESAKGNHPLVKAILSGNIRTNSRQHSKEEIMPDHSHIKPEKQAMTHTQETQVESYQNGVKIQIPLTITISVGDGNFKSNGKEEPSLKTAESIDPNYGNRMGYEPSFLVSGKLAVSLPKLSPTLKAKAALNREAKRGVEPYILPYRHFSIVMNKERRTAFFTAVNIDGSVSYRLKRDSDNWILDPRIDDNEQAGEALYRKNDLDRGHLVRRLDPAWGANQNIAQVANDDTFHFTNAAPQHKDLNQKTWLGLENYILDNADNLNFKVSVFSGPILRDDDEIYRGIQLPKEFWKVVVMAKEDGNLSATAYLLSQESLLRNLEATFVFGKHKTFQVSVKKIAELTGLDFGKLSNFDPMEDQRESMGETELEIVSYDDIVF